MRFVSRLHLCAAASIFMVLYFTWLHQTTTFTGGIPVFFKASKHRVVVFGNDWSDVGSYRARSLAPPTNTLRDTDRGEIWVETLCQEIGCDSIDNFARSSVANSETSRFGPVVDAYVLAQAKHSGFVDVNSTAFDFRAQAQQFLEYDRVRPSLAQRLRKTEQQTTFTVYFGLWDILEYSTLEYEPASKAIEASITLLFGTLDLLATNATRPIKVVVPRMIDLTFLPWVQSMKFATQEHFAEHQHQLVFLVKYWNTVLYRVAKAWKNGKIFVPDPNPMILEQIRIAQLYAREISDARGIGKQEPLFEEIEHPCLSLKQDVNVTGARLTIQKCHDPSRYLFWDDIRLSGRAHHIIGMGAANLVHRNQTVNERAVQGTDDNQNPEDQEATSFNLKYPPGY